MRLQIMHTNNSLRSRRSVLKGKLRAAIRRRKVPTKEMKVGKPVDLQLTSECECVICMETLSAKNIAVTPCGHKFCFTCLMENFKSSNKCPLCREVVAPEIPRPRLDDEDIGDFVYLNGQEMVQEVVKSAKRWDKYEALCRVSEEEREENQSFDTTELFEAFGPQFSEDEPSQNSAPTRGAVPEWAEVMFETDSEEDSEDEDSDEDSEDDSDTESSASFISYDDLAEELLERTGGKLSDREKKLVTICLEHVGRSSVSVRDWYDRNKTI